MGDDRAPGQLIPSPARRVIESVRASPVEFTAEALRDLEDLPAVARAVSRDAQRGRPLCGQGDPCVRELWVDATRVAYRIEAEQIVVLWAAVDPRHVH